MSFFTVINCMDGRVQLPVINYIMENYGVEYVDSITEPGPIRLLSIQADGGKIESMLDKVRISLNVHNSKGLALVGHYDCAGNPANKEEQLKQLEESRALLRQHFDSVPTVLLWVDENWQVHRVG